MKGWEGRVQGHGTEREREDGPAPVAALDVAELTWEGEGEGEGAGREGWAEAESTRRCVHTHVLHAMPYMSAPCNDGSRKPSS